jgi:hypothetical protein
MSDERYYCYVCDTEFKNNNGLTIHTNRSKAHAKRAMALGTMPPVHPDPEPESEEQPPELPEPVVVPELDWAVSTPQTTEDGFAFVAPESTESVADALGDIDLSYLDDEEPKVPLETIDLTVRVVPTKGARANRKVNVSLRTLKMLAPRCLEHNDSTPGWWYTCLELGHDPYQQIVERTENVRKLSQPDERGRRKVLGVEPEVYFVQSYVWRQLPFTGKHNGGIELSQATGKGWVLPEKRGVSPLCQFLDCWVPNPQISTPYGDFCTRPQAQIVAAEATNTFLVVNDGTIRARQIAALGV